MTDGGRAEALNEALIALSLIFSQCTPPRQSTVTKNAELGTQRLSSSSEFTEAVTAHLHRISPLLVLSL